MNIQEIANEHSREIIKNIFSKLDDEEKYVKLMLTGDKDARNKLIEHNLRLVAHIAKKYSSTNVSKDDLFYLTSKGLSEISARRLLETGFLISEFNDNEYKTKISVDNMLGDYFGNNLLSWIKEFQKNNNLEVDGNIGPKTLITEEMISKMSVPQSFIKGTYYKNYNDIVGKYSNYNTTIAEGSIFYSTLLVEEENLPDAMFYDVNEGERIVSFPVTTASTYGNSIMPSNKVDIYVKLMDGDKVVYGQYFEKVEILAVKDASGNNVFESSEETRTPSFIY